MNGPEAAAVGFGLASAASWGGGDFSGGLASRRANVLSVAPVSRVAGVTVQIVLALASAEHAPSASTLAWSVAAGCSGAIGLVALYRSLAVGVMGINSPLTAVLAAAFPVLIGALTQGTPTAVRLVGFALALAGVWCLSRPGRMRARPRGLGLAALGGLGFGGFYVLTLNSILGFAQLLDMGPLPPDKREDVGQILKGGRHVLELINEVLDLARIEAGQTATSLELVPLHESLRETLTLITPLATKANVRLHDETAAALERHILADRQRFKQVLLNLLSNAVKYNRPGGSVTLSYEDAGHGQLRIKVGDTGPGIPKEKMHRLFAPFDRLGAEQTEIEGTGLGLTLCRHLVEAMGGTLGVESVEGRGSTFWVKFTQAEAPS